MKTSNDIYNDVTKKFYNKTNIVVERGTVIDSYMLALSDTVAEAYVEIENNKTPHIYSSLKGENLDNLALLFGLSRRADESDKNFLYRITKANTSNQASNYTTIETALMDMQYASHVTYVPHAFGCGTAAAYIIPKVMDEENNNLAIEETKKRLNNVISPSTYIEYIIPTIVKLDFNILIKATNADLENIKNNISDKIVKYVNGIAPGANLEIGELNRIGNAETNVIYFNVSNVFVNGTETGQVSILQKVESKFMIDKTNLNWMEVE